MHNIKENCEDLQTSMEKLWELWDDITTRVRVCENDGLQAMARVKGWLSRVVVVEDQVSKLLASKDQEIDRLCVGGYCSKNFVSIYKYGKKVAKKLTEVKDLTKEGAFSEVAQRGLAPVVDERPLGVTVGLDAMLVEVWSFLMKDEISILGLYGMGGVGKTTLLTRINNMILSAPIDFDAVIWVSVSKEAQIRKIQDDIGKKLGLFDDKWQPYRQDEKALDIFRKLRGKKFILLLDDLWTRIDLTSIGIPVPDAKDGCKIIFNTRSRDVCGRMEADRAIEVECLKQNYAWDLFQRKVGYNTLNGDPRILRCAQRIARKCRGLPLALSTIGLSMRSKTTVEEWEKAIDDLTTSLARSADMVDAVLPLLRFSFDEINDEIVQSSFLFCALLPEDYAIEKDELVDFWIGEGILDGYENRNMAARRGYEIIHHLVNACLLVQEGSKHVKMHDVIRQMALWVASDSKRDMDYSIFRTHGRENEISEVVNWGAVKRMSLMNYKIEDIPGFRFPNLLTLIARRNLFLNISNGFFLSLQSLKVLDLSQNENLEALPGEISQLESLQHLDLSWTSVSWLPQSFRKLVRLKYLNLENTECEGISAVSSLHNLQTLRLYNCGFNPSRWGSILSLEELAGLNHLEVLSISVIQGSAMSDLLNLKKLADSVRLLSLVKFEAHNVESDEERDAIDISSFSRMSNLQSLIIYMSYVTRVFMHPKTARMQRQLSRNFSFHNLSNVTIELCPKLQDLTWLVLAPNLTHLTLYELEMLEEVIRKSEVDSFIVVQPYVIPFLKLKDLTLISIPKLKSINEGPLPFPCLQHITVVNCPELKKLPLDAESANGDLKLVIQGSEEWINNIEWEDEATKEAFTLSY